MRGKGGSNEGNYFYIMKICSYLNINLLFKKKNWLYGYYINCYIILFITPMLNL